MTMPKVSIIIQAYSPKQKRYLDLCVKAVRNLDYPLDNLDISIVSHKEYNPQYEGIRTILFDNTNYHNPEALNRAFRAADKDSQFFFMINDDVVVTKNSLKNMVNACGNSELIVGPISQCDNYWLYKLHIGFKDENGGFAEFSGRFYKYEDVEQFQDQLINADSIYPQGLIFEPYLCLFAHLIPRSVWEKVGEWDENFKTGQDDVDFCYRAQQLKIRCAVALDAFIFHFGGATTSTSIGIQTRKENIDYFYKKWGIKAPC